MRRSLLLLSAVLALFLLVPTGRAQEKTAATFFKGYDVAAVGFTYPLLTGQGLGPFSTSIPGNAPVTAAASTTVASTTASTNAFLNNGVNDWIFLQAAPGTAVLPRQILAKASADSVTVDASTTVTNRPFSYMHFTNGTTATDGWINAVGTNKTLQLCVQTLNATSVTFSVEAKLVNAPAPATLIAPVYTAVPTGGCDAPMMIPETVDQLRVGIKVTGDAGVQSVSALYQGMTNR